ncbi:MAG: hypothetical protein J1F16_07675 [Muribaculaceae bacterium]|nr:hypothetical protein [Muribaculaceae bacterium]
MDIPLSLLSQTIERGTILLSDSFADIDHAKFFVIIGIFEDKIAGFFFINSRIHPLIFSKPAQLEMQFLLKKEDYDFLRYDSFLGANEILVREISVLTQSMKNGQTQIVGQLHEKDLKHVLEACRNSDLFTPKEKRQFFY